MVSVLVLDGGFDVRPLLLRWDAGLLSGDGGFNWVGVFSEVRSSIVGVKCEGERLTVEAEERETAHRLSWRKWISYGCSNRFRAPRCPTATSICFFVYG